MARACWSPCGLVLCLGTQLPQGGVSERKGTLQTPLVLGRVTGCKEGHGLEQGPWVSCTGLTLTWGRLLEA